ncbi:hypothetical protein [Streptomyces sp. NPDC020983]|uniref:hypothetical protein n=1 Tax=Streptomyces sp. NPDC020983 TaxID=3365106 RepID=UPI00379FDC9F
MMASHGSRRRRRGWLAAVASAATLATGTGVAVAATGSAAPVNAAPAAAATAKPAPEALTVQVVSPGQKISVGGGSVWLTSKGLALAPKDLGSASPTVVPVAGVLPGKVSTVASGSSSGVVWAGVFRLPVTSTTSVTVGSVKAKVITLAGKPGWGAFYAFDTKGTADAKPAILIHN